MILLEIYFGHIFERSKYQGGNYLVGKNSSNKTELLDCKKMESSKGKESHYIPATLFQHDRITAWQ